MNSVPIFDSLTHPMPVGGWLNRPGYEFNTVESLLISMEQSNVQWAFAVGMSNQFGGYVEDKYASYVRSFSEKLFPIAFVDFELLKSGTKVTSYLNKIKRLGYFGIKIHPRLAKINFSNKLLPPLIKEANQLGLCVLICTYSWSKNKVLCKNSIDKLHELLCEVPDERTILLHGGVVRLLELAEIVRQFHGALLDLSFTICKYEGSSLDQDIKYLFENFDRRLCVGSDSPEFNQSHLRNRFDAFAIGLAEEKKQNIAYRNLHKHLGVACG